MKQKPIDFPFRPAIKPLLSDRVAIFLFLLFFFGVGPVFAVESNKGNVQMYFCLEVSMYHYETILFSDIFGTTSENGFMEPKRQDLCISFR